MKKNEEPKNINELIINEAVKQFKEGKIQNSLDVENYLDSLLQPLMQKLLDTELENHLKYKRYTHLKGKSIENMRNGYCKTKNVKTKYGNIKIKTPKDRNGSFSPVIIEYEIFLDENSVIIFIQDFNYVKQQVKKVV